MKKNIRWRAPVAAITVAAAMLFGIGHAAADTTLRVGKAIALPFDFVPLDVGMQNGFFKKHSLDIAAAVMHQAPEITSRAATVRN